jgi:YfiH family protein
MQSKLLFTPPELVDQLPDRVRLGLTLASIESEFINPERNIHETRTVFNLAYHLGDDLGKVLANRQRLDLEVTRQWGLDGEYPLRWQWLQQVHGTKVIAANSNFSSSTDVPLKGDALFTIESNFALAILSADCLPVVCWSDSGDEIAIAHAGWRGLCGGVLENTLAHFSCPVEEINIWLGPAIAACHFEVGEEVRAAFVESMGAEAKLAFSASIQSLSLTSAPDNEVTVSQLLIGSTNKQTKKKWQADLYQLAILRLLRCGIKNILCVPRCTVCSVNEQGQPLWFSHRRVVKQGPVREVEGRFATFISKC